MSPDHWWVTRPKRKLNAVPEELAAFSSVALGKKWYRNRDAHIAFEEGLERANLKRVGERRDQSGSGGRTHAAMMYSLGLWFEKDGCVYLTLAGDAMLSGKSPVQILKKQVLDFQYPSAYSRSVRIAKRFEVHPFRFLLKLLSDKRIGFLTQDEIAFVVAINAENEHTSCYENVVSMILKFRSYSNDWHIFGNDYLSDHNATEGNLQDVANTMMNWLDYTQLVYREKKTIQIDFEKEAEVKEILSVQKPFIKYPVEDDVFQRAYGVDPWHKKDLRNLLDTKIISSKNIEKGRILQAFFNYASLTPVLGINAKVINDICEKTATDKKFTETVLLEAYPHGALDSYLINYRNMAFQGRDEAVDFEIATENLFRDVFGYSSEHYGQKGAKSAPDVLIASDSEKYQAIIDNKAYGKYSISGDHHNRMVHNYIEKLYTYSNYRYPLGFFLYISGGFGKNIDQQIQKEATEAQIHGSAINVSNLISLIQEHNEHPFSHKELCSLFSLDRQILSSDLHH